MIFIEVSRAQIDRELRKLEQQPALDPIEQAFYAGARIALEWMRDGATAPSEMYRETPRGTDS